MEINSSGLANTPGMETRRKDMNVRENIVTLGQLGRGASGVVYKAVHVPTLRRLAIKVLTWHLDIFIFHS